MTTRPPNAQFTHVGIYVRDLDAMIGFYTRVLGLIVTDSGDYYRGGRIAFLSRNRAEHHQLVLASGRADDGATTTINQLSFRVDTLEDLRAFYPRLLAEPVRELGPRNHGNAWSIYFLDPEHNRVELYTPSPWYVAQPYGKPLDLTASAEVIRAETNTMVKDDPSCIPMQRWSAEMDRKLAQAPKS